jgi:hypothetical protein
MLHAESLNPTYAKIPLLFSASKISHVQLLSALKSAELMENSHFGYN